MTIPRLIAAFRFTTCVVLLSVAPCAGCRNSAQNGRLEVTGHVTVDDTPLESGVVLFMSEDTPPAIGEIDTDGSFEMRTDANSDGVVAGNYRVCIIAPNMDAAKTTERNRPEQSVAPLIPQRYMSVGTSGLEFTVKPGGPNVADFKLTSQPAE